jgi:hypothetical protein
MLIAAGGADGPTRSAGSIAAEIRSEGSRPVVHRLWDSGEFDRILEEIAAGDNEWIAISPELAAGADAGAAEGLGVALARALPKNAAAVLSVLDPGQPSISVARVCGLPFIEVSKSDLEHYRDQAEAALRQVHGAALADRKAVCLADLRR